MNIQALLGARPSTGSSRRPAASDKGKDRARASAAATDTQDVVEISVEGRERAASDTPDER